MAYPRACDYDLLKQLVVDHPDWSYPEYKRVLDADNAEHGRKPIGINRISDIISRSREEWEAESGRRIPVRIVTRHVSSPPEGTVHPDHKNDSVLRYLRELDARDLGIEPTGDTSVILREQAIRWARRMREDLTIVDLTSGGAPITRDARTEEVNGKGELIALAAWLVPGWRTPRRAAAR